MGDGCWEWTAGLRNGEGYGNFHLRGRNCAAHRVSYAEFVGPIPEGADLDHLCRNRRCVRPSHLEPVTRKENLHRGQGVAAKNKAKTHCPQGHPYDAENTVTHTHRTGSVMRYCRICMTKHKRAYAAKIKSKKGQ